MISLVVKLLIYNRSFRKEYYEPSFYFALSILIDAISNLHIFIFNFILDTAISEINYSLIQEFLEVLRGPSL